jgi:A/G-specific adenine glycosylase
VGPYTAAAVACFAFGVPVPAVDTNLKRVLGRWLGRTPTDGDANDLLDPARPQDWNQAMMDLGATICRPRSPSCGSCPVRSWCVDPGFYRPPVRQSVYEGSVRQARAALLKHLAAQGAVAPGEAADRLGLAAEKVAAALEALRTEGRIRIRDGRAELCG